MTAAGLQYEFFTPAHIVFGWGEWSRIGPLAARIGRRAFLIVGSRGLMANGFVGELVELLDQHGVEAVELAAIHHEPEVADVDRVARRIREIGVRTGDMVVGLGGGSAMDLAKAAAALATQTSDASVLEYLEGVGSGLSLTESPLPVVTVPTTAGTGSEATKNAVISSYDPPFKKSLRHQGLVSRLVIVDPELTLTLTPELTAQCGLDAITQLIESYLSCRRQPIPQSMSIDGLRRAIPALGEAVQNGVSRAAREAMAHAALLSGMALANSGLGLAHGVAAALGALYRVPHGLACAVMLPPTLRFNRVACEPQMAELARATELAPPGSADTDAAEELITTIANLCDSCGLARSLSEFGVRIADIPTLARASRGNSLDGNPRPVEEAAIIQLLEELL